MLLKVVFLKIYFKSLDLFAHPPTGTYLISEKKKFSIRSVRVLCISHSTKQTKYTGIGSV